MKTRILTLGAFAVLSFAALAAEKAAEKAPWEVKPAKPGPANVMDYGAKGDGLTDDTAAIQAAINAVAARGGGKVFFPATKGGYRLASPARETVGGKPCRSQLYIPPGRHTILLEGEMPPLIEHSDYAVIPLDPEPTSPNNSVTRFGTLVRSGARLVSDWKPPVETNSAARPWAMLSVLPGYTSKYYPLNGNCVAIQSLEFRACLDKERMYAIQTAVNLTTASRAIVRDSQFMLNDTIGDGTAGKELQESACPTAGLVMSREMNDDQVIHNVNVQGFKYGIVMAEHTYATYVYLHNNENGLVFTWSDHLSTVDFVTAQHNRRILSVPDEKIFERRCRRRAPVNVNVRGVSIETGEGDRPLVSRLEYGVYDPNDRLRGEIEYHILTWGSDMKTDFPVLGAKNYKVRRFGE